MDEYSWTGRPPASATRDGLLDPGQTGQDHASADQNGEAEIGSATFSVSEWRRQQQIRVTSPVQLHSVVFFAIIASVSFGITYTANVFASDKLRAVATALNRMTP